MPYSLFAIGCLLAAAASRYVLNTNADLADTRAHVEFLADSDQMRRQIQAGLDSHIEVVRAGAVLLSADNEINGAEFRRFVTGLRLPERYPALQGIGFAPCVGARDLGRFLRLIDLDGSRVRLWPTGPRSTYCPTIFFEPRTAATTPSLGFDIASVAALAATMATARDTGEPAASGRVMDLPVWDSEQRGRVVLVIPVYRLTASPLADEQARRRAFIGYVFGPVDGEALLQTITASRQPTLTLDVRDGASAIAPRLATRAAAAPTPPRFSASERVRFADREWQVDMQSLTGPDAIATTTARQTLVAGIALSLMLFLVSRAQARAWETAAQHEIELQASAEALRQSEAQARAANVAKDEFLATVSHELRTPLNVVLGWVNMLRRQTVAPEGVARALEIVERNARQQAQLIDDLLDVSRIVIGQLRLDIHPLALAPVVSAVIESLRPSAEDKDVELNADIGDDPCAMVGDPDRLRQTIWNVVANAIKFTPPGGQVHVSLASRNDRIVLTVRDTGVGIESSFLPHVFERFRQADSSLTRVHSGVGLGLAIARHLVELHGGTIEARSGGSGQGATFVVELPAAPAATPTEAAPLVAPADAALAPQLTGVRVLVVDDDAGTLEMLTTALRTTGAQVLSAQSAVEALEHVNADRPDVIVSDIAMPGEDGLWLIRRVRTLDGARAKTPAIALTALARREDRDRVIDAGYQRHVVKPVELTDLQSHVAALVAEYGTGFKGHDASA